MLALVVFVSGMSNMSLSTLADDTIQETTAISEETTDTKEDATPAKEDATPAKEDATPAKEDVTPAKEDATPAKEDATLAEEDATVWEESTKDVTAELGRAENPVKKIVDTPLKKAVRAVLPEPSGLGRFEAENCDTVHGSGSEPKKNSGNENFSNSGWVSDMNTWPNDEPSYITTNVNCPSAGRYEIKIGYTAGINGMGDDKSKPTEIDVRVNDGEWIHIDGVPLTDSWNTVSVVSKEINLKKGNNKIDVTGARNVWYGDTNNWQWVNLDYFDLVAIEVPAEGRHEAEHADSYTQGGAKNPAKVDINADNDWNKKFSGSGYVGNLNSYPLDDEGKDIRSYLTQKLYAERPGKYLLTIGYAYRNNAGDGSKPTNIDVRLNGGSWKSVTANQTADWNDVREVSTVIELKRGENTIDITGASNIWYAGTGDYWQQINLDYFDISSPLAEGIHEAEEYHVSGNKSDDKQYKIKDDGGGIYSENKYATIWNTLTGEEHEYLGYNVYAQHAGKYKLAVKYGTKYDGDIFVKIGKGEWKQLSAPSTGEWNVVKTVEMDITLPKGENTIYIAGRQTTGNKYNEYINIDCFELTRQVDKSNIALDKPVRTSGNRSDDVNDKDNYKRYFPEEAVDGYDDSRWGGRANQNENWFEIDLEGIYEINQVMLKFERAYPKDFEIQVSRDRKSWTTTETVKGWTPSENADPNAKYQWNSNISYHGKARYIRINATSLKNKGWGLSIWEFVVKGDKLPADVKDVAVNKTATASSSNENEVAWAIDGKDDSRWGSISGDAQWYQINLGKEYALHSVDLKFERAYPEDFTIKTSKDGKSWETIKTVTGWKNPGSAGNLSSSARVGYSFKLDSEKNASYIRIESSKAANSSWGLSIWEFEAWGKETNLQEYWKDVQGKKYGIYPVDKLYDKTETEKAAHMKYADGSEKDYTILNSDLVQGDVLATNDTYEVVYEPGKNNYIYFYVNPRDIHIDFGEDENNEKDKVRWSGNSKDANLVKNNNKWGANDYNSDVLEFCGQKAATVQYKIKDLGNKDSVSTWIGCQIYGTTNNVSDLGKKDPKFEIKIKINITKAHSLSIVDTIEEDGCLGVKDPQNIKYKWQRSSDGVNDWQDIPEKRDDMQVLYNGGKKLDVSRDAGGGMYYRVSEDGKDDWSLVYRVNYYNNVQNGDFENPIMCTPGKSGASFPFNANGDEQQYPNGYPGLYWKTTGPGWQSINGGTKVGHDIEIVNGRNLKVNKEYQEGQFSVTYEEMYKDGTHGDQFAELNCENIGALYQDILTTPSSECYWDLDHAGRWNQNTMYVVAMAARDARKYMTPEQLNPNNGMSDTFIQKLKAMDNNNKLVNSTGYDEGTEINLKDGIVARVWKVRSESVAAGHWEHHKGKYKVPSEDKDHLTRFFFVSVEGGGKTQSAIRNGGDLTVGNLLDNVSFEMRKNYSITYKLQEYDANGNLNTVTEHTIEGKTVPGGKVVVPSSFKQDGTTYNLSDYTLTNAKMNDKDFYYNNKGQMTVEFNHDTLVLVYVKNIITVTKIVQGVEEKNLPKDYKVTVELAKVNGNQKKLVTLSDFKEIEKVNANDAGGLFASGTIQASELGLQDGDRYTVVEKVDRTFNGKDNNRYALVQITDSINETINNLPVNAKQQFEYSIGASGINYKGSQSNSATITNIYKPTRTIKVTKKVEGKFGERDKSFKFTLTLSEAAVSYNDDTFPNDRKVTSNGSTYSFSLKHNESIEFVVPDGCTASVSEDDYSSEGYVTTWNSEIKNVVISENKSTTCTNSRDLTPTGLNNRAKPFIILLGCALLAVACFVAGKKGKFRKLG